MRRSTKIVFFLLLAIVSSMNVVAQVTTSSMTGVIKTDKGEPLVGATVTLKHEPTGSVFTVVTRAGGRFDVANLPPGGPYSVKASYVGYNDFTKGDINIPLGERFDLEATISAAGTELQSVTISAGRRSTTVKTGASTNISNRLVQNLPNVSRSLTNLTRITPQANGNSFAGMNNRYNNITIDGSLFNNNFGRSGDGMIPGGATSAISIDAVDQVQVNIAPYDVRQSGFVGGGINAVTRRGTNNWYGTAYGYYRDQSFNGEKVKGQTVPNADRSTKIFGASIGGPIIKDKLFFFVNYEQEKRSQPGQTFLAKTSATDNNPNATAVLASDLDRLRTHLINTYKFDPGGYQGYDFATENKKFLGRIDWNINAKHRVSFRYTQSTTDDDDQINASSTASPIPRISNSRRGGSNGGMAYTSSNFKNNVVVKSGVLELNSNFSTKVSNQLIASYTDNQLKRDPAANISFVDIMRDADNVYISFGNELFSYLNNISDKALNISDNVTWNLGKHTITGGASFEALSFANSFTSGAGPSYYRYASLQDFIDNKAPTHFSVAYDPNNRLGIKIPEAKFNQLGVYAQDVWSPSNKFKLTYGLRVDMPFYPYDPPRNQRLETYTFKNEDGNPERFDVSKWPKQKPLFSPRVGFTYDPIGDKSLIVRGGTGLFTGRIPFIWLVNQVGDNGVIRAQFNANATQLANTIRYNPDRTAYIPPQSEIAPVGTAIPAGRPSYSGVAEDFKLPQVWRSNLAIDKRFANDFVFTLEAIYTKQVNNAYFRNANLGDQNGTLNGNNATAADKRPYYNTRLNDSIAQMIVLDNTNKGHSLSLTAQIQKTFSNNWEAGLAYTYTAAKEVAIGSSDQSASGFNTNNIIFNPNKPDIGQSNFAIPHRIVFNVSKRFNYWSGKMSTTIGAFYSAQPQERYTYRYGSDINGDGQSNDVLYVPKDASEIQFVEGFKVGSNVYTAKQQSDAFFAYVENDKYLRKNKGKYMEKYAGLLPWVHGLDVRVLQDFNFQAGGRKHTIQFSVDLINALNLLNSEWGYRYQYTFGTFQDMGILGTPTSGSNSNNTGNEGFNRNNAKFTFNPNNAKQGYQPNYSTTSTWGLQLGLRYIFN